MSIIITLGGLSSATSFYIYISLSPFKKFYYFFLLLRYSRAHGARGFSIDITLYSVFSKYLPLVSKGGWLPPFHALSSATHEIKHIWVAMVLTSSSCNLGIKFQ